MYNHSDEENNHKTHSLQKNNSNSRHRHGGATETASPNHDDDEEEDNDENDHVDGHIHTEPDISIVKKEKRKFVVCAF